MAQMIPEYLPDHATQGERAIFAALQALPPEVLVFYEPIVKRRYPDFIVIDPQAGVLVIEVKGWRAGWILEASRKEIRIRQAGQERIDDHPLLQARKYQDRLMSLCQSHPQGRLLLTPRGKFACAFGHVAILTGISRQGLGERGLDEVFPAGSTICSDEWEAALLEGAEAIRRLLLGAFDPEIPCRPLTMDRVNVLRGLIHPVVRLDRPASSSSSVAPAEQEDIRLLDFEQERCARDMRSGHRIIYGVAGSGKTVILIARAKLLAEDESKQILVLCYNVPFAEHLRKTLGVYSNISVSTFGQWARQQRAPINLTSEEAFGQGLLVRLECGEGDAGRFDAILIDEGQDFAPSWFKCAVDALKDPAGSDLVIAYDTSQNLYKRLPISWSALGVRIKGGKGGSRTTRMSINYRNTKEIIAAACTFALPPSPRDDDAPESLAIDAAAARRQGPWPVVLKVSGRDATIAQSAAIAEQITQGGYLAGDLSFTAAPGDIRIVYVRDEDGLRARLQHVLHAKSLDAIQLTTVHKAKGLQAKVVMLICAEQLPSQFPERDEQAERALFYVALTRPEDLLIVLYTYDTPYVSELLRNIARARGEEHA